MQMQRIEKLRNNMSANGIESALIISPENRYYFSNFRGTSGALLITMEQCFLFTDFRYVKQAENEAPIFEIVQHQQSILASICEYISKLSIKYMGYEMGKMSVTEYFEIHEILPALELSNIEPLIADIRMYKDKDEIQNIKQGITICDQAFSHILNFIRPGISEKEIGLELEFFMRKAGAEGIKSNHVIASGERSSLPHGQATERIVQIGDFVKMDIGARVNGYYSDFTRTTVLGEPTDKQREIYEIVKCAQEASLSFIGPGKVCSEIDEVARSIIREAGYGDRFGHSLGHSIGLSVHERPTMRSTDDTILKPGMVITVEPGIYIPGFGGVRIEDLIVITEDGFINFTQSTKELQIIPI